MRPAIGIGAPVSAAIMSIAAANLYTRNIQREFINHNPTDKQEAQIAKWVSLIVTPSPNYPLVFADYTLPGYTALYTVILSLVIVIVLTPILNSLGGKQRDETVATDYQPGHSQA